MNFIMFYQTHIQVQVINTYENKNYDHNLVIEDFGDQKRIFRNRAIQKNGQNIFFYQTYQLEFYTNYLDINA